MGHIAINCKGDVTEDPLSVVVAASDRNGLIEVVPRVMQDAYNGNSFVSCRNRDCRVYATGNHDEAFSMVQAHTPGLLVVEYSFSGQIEDDISRNKIVIPARKEGYLGRILGVGWIGHRTSARAAGCDEFLTETEYFMPEEVAHELGCVTGDTRLKNTLKFLLDDCPFEYVGKKRG